MLYDRIIILDDSVVLKHHWINDEKWEQVMAFPRGGLTYLIQNNAIKFFLTNDYFYRNTVMSLELPLYIVDETMGIDGEYSDITELTEILDRIFPSSNGEVDLTPYLKKVEAEELYQPIGDYLTEIPDNYVTDEDLDDVLEDYLTKDEAAETYQPIGNYLTKESGDTLYQPIGNYLTEHQPLKTINGQVVSGTGNIEIDCSGGTVDAYTKAESDARYQPIGNYLTKASGDTLYQPKGNYLTKASGDTLYQPIGNYATEQWVLNKNYISQIKTINNQSLSGTGNITIEGGSVTVDSALSTTSENPVQNKVITNKINTKLDSTAYTAPVQSDWNATSGLAFIKNKPTIPTVPTNVSAFNNDAGYITSASTVFNNYYTKTEGDGKYATQNMLNNSVNYLQTQINNLIDAYGECCTGMTLSGTAVIRTTSTTQLVDIGPANSIQVFKTPAKTIYPAASGSDTFSLGASGNVSCSFKLIEGITTLGQFQQGRWDSVFSLKYQFNGGFTSIGQGCFSGSTLLQILDFHDGLTEIRGNAFDECNSLRTLTFRSTTPPTLALIGNRTALDTLNDTNTSFVIKVPASSLNAYKTASGWSTFASRIEAIS